MSWPDIVLLGLVAYLAYRLDQVGIRLDRLEDRLDFDDEA